MTFFTLSRERTTLQLQSPSSDNIIQQLDQKKLISKLYKKTGSMSGSGSGSISGSDSFASHKRTQSLQIQNPTHSRTSSYSSVTPVTPIASTTSTTSTSGSFKTAKAPAATTSTSSSYSSFFTMKYDQPKAISISTGSNLNYNNPQDPSKASSTFTASADNLTGFSFGGGDFQSHLNTGPQLRSIGSTENLPMTNGSIPLSSDASAPTFYDTVVNNDQYSRHQTPPPSYGDHTSVSGTGSRSISRANSRSNSRPPSQPVSRSSSRAVSMSDSLAAGAAGAASTTLGLSLGQELTTMDVNSTSANMSMSTPTTPSKATGGAKITDKFKTIGSSIFGLIKSTPKSASKSTLSTATPTTTTPKYATLPADPSRISSTTNSSHPDQYNQFNQQDQYHDDLHDIDLLDSTPDEELQLVFQQASRMATGAPSAPNSELESESDRISVINRRIKSPRSASSVSSISGDDSSAHVDVISDFPIQRCPTPDDRIPFPTNTTDHYSSQDIIDSNIHVNIENRTLYQTQETYQNTLDNARNTENYSASDSEHNNTSQSDHLTIYDVLSGKFAQFADKFIEGSSIGTPIGLLNDVRVPDMATSTTTSMSTASLDTTSCTNISALFSQTPICSRCRSANRSNQCSCLRNVEWRRIPGCEDLVPWTTISLGVDRKDATVPLLIIGGNQYPLSSIDFVVPGKRREIKNVNPNTAEIKSKTCCSIVIGGQIHDLALQSSDLRDSWVMGLNELLTSARETGLIATKES